MALPAAGIVGIAAGAGAIGGFMNKKRPVPSMTDLLGLLAPILQGKGTGENTANFKKALEKMFDFLADPSVPDSIRRRTMGNITSAFTKAQDVAARTSAIGGGPLALTEASRAFSTGRQGADAEVGFQKLEHESQFAANQQILALQDFLLQATKARFGLMSGGSTLSRTLSGAFAGASAGSGFAGALSGLGGGGGVGNTTPGQMPGEPGPFDPIPGNQFQFGTGPALPVTPVPTPFVNPETFTFGGLRPRR